jgi:hypothetical protein
VAQRSFIDRSPSRLEEKSVCLILPFVNDNQGESAVHFFDLLGTPDQYVLAQLDSAYGEGIVNRETVQR